MEARLIVVIVPVGRGNWKRVELSIASPADLFPAVREGMVSAGDLWQMAGRWWRVVEVRT